MKKVILLTITSAAALMFTTIPLKAGCKDSLSFDITKQGFHYWEGLDIGFNGFLNPSRQIALPANYSFLELDYARSFSFAWNMSQYNFHLYENYVNLVTGLGLEWNSYAFRRNMSLIPGGSTIDATVETYDFSKNKLKMTYINVPLMVEFNTNASDDDRSVHLSVGGSFGYNIFRNRLKQEYDVDGNEKHRKMKDDFNVNPFRYGLTARVGYGDYSLFTNYSLSDVFRAGQGPKMNHFSVGIHIDL
jgi:hypothetical protein